MSELPKPDLRRIRAALFDLDGTLVRTNIDFTAMRNATVDYCIAAGVDARGLRETDILGAIDLASESLPPEQRPDFLRQGWTMLEEIEMAYVPEAVPYEGAGALLCEMHQRGILLAVVTRNCARAARALMETLPSCFAAVLAREDVSRVKPDPLHVRTALELIDVQPRDAVMVGDHRMDISAGRAAGAITAGLLWGREQRVFDPDRPDYIFADLKAFGDALVDSHR